MVDFIVIINIVVSSSKESEIANVTELVAILIILYTAVGKILNFSLSLSYS